ncbi:MAG: HAMP domain-containing sensor histidine kinase [Nostoc sp.]|uniref:HAMP domain-containing sensor histidine kinase n=1 Tax=Nostoc sp. TaxID=1180 RepID=UPI002FF714D4
MSNSQSVEIALAMPYPSGSKLRVTSRREGIADNAGRMSEYFKNHIFNSFFTTKPVGKGKGIGMAINYQILTEKHGGKLECFFSLGEGSEFLIQSPTQQQFSTAA